MFDRTRGLEKRRGAMALEEKEREVGQLTFKEASVELERVVRQLESGDLELEDALERYTRGVELLRSLRSRRAARAGPARQHERGRGPRYHDR